MSSLLFLILVSTFLGLISFLLFLWATKTNQFDDIEGPKYRMLDDDDQEQGADERNELPKGTQKTEDENREDNFESPKNKKGK